MKIGSFFRPRNSKKTNEELVRLYRSFQTAVRHKNHIRAARLPDIEDIDVSLYKKADTVFILGSGWSINELNRRQWNIIAQHDSIGFNFFAVHDFVPTWYFYETSKNQEKHELFLEIMNSKREAYNSVPMVIHYDHAVRSGIDIDALRNACRLTYFNAPYRYRTTSERLFRLALRLRRILAFLFPFNLGSVIHNPASVTILITFAMIVGYRRIVLLGVDMNDARYFYDVDPAPNAFYSRIRSYRSSYAPERPHETVVPSFTARYGAIPLDRAIVAINDVLLRPKGIKLFVGSERSRLAEYLPIFKLPSTNHTEPEEVADVCNAGESAR